jgi:hypothetical protein
MKVPEQFRITVGDGATTKEDGNNGVFLVQHKKHFYQVIASDGEGWDHVSVIIKGVNRTPRWDEMCMIKDLFFHPDEVAVQFHPKESDYINVHPYCLHLWRCHEAMPTPPIFMV